MNRRQFFVSIALMFSAGLGIITAKSNKTFFPKSRGCPFGACKYCDNAVIDSKGGVHVFPHTMFSKLRNPGRLR